MHKRLKEKDIKNWKYHFFDDITDIKIPDPNKSKIDEKSYKNILLLHWIGDSQKP